MSWICPQDGADVPDEANACALCGYVRVPSGVVLRSDASGKELHVRIDTTLGRRALSSLGDPEDRFVDTEQFRLEKHAAAGGWTARSLPGATNPLFLNGGPLDPGGTVLKDGDRLSIKGKYFHLTVTLLK